MLMTELMRAACRAPPPTRAHKSWPAHTPLPFALLPSPTSLIPSLICRTVRPWFFSWPWVCPGGERPCCGHRRRQRTNARLEIWRRVVFQRLPNGHRPTPRSPTHHDCTPFPDDGMLGSATTIACQAGEAWCVGLAGDYLLAGTHQVNWRGKGSG